MKGTIVRKREEGYGFIKPETGEKDVFFHASAIINVTFDELSEGDAVTFEIVDGPKGPAAANIERVAAPAATATDDTSASDDASDDSSDDTDETTAA